MMKAVMYHYIREDSPQLPHFRYLHVDDFRAQLDYFQKEFGFVEKKDFLDAFTSGMPPPGIVLTFDDGLSDHYRVSRELARRGLWGIFYVPTGPLESGAPLDVHRVHMLLGRFGGKAVYEEMKKLVSNDMLTHQHREEFRSRTYSAQSGEEETAVKRTLNYYIDRRHRKKILDALARAFFEDEKALFADFYLKPSELREMRDAGMLIGSHTVTHLVMSTLSHAEQEQEILGSFAFLEKTLGAHAIKTYCHPYGGAHSYNADTQDILERERSAFSFDVAGRDIESEDLASKRQTLPRYDCNTFPHGKVRQVTT